MNARVSTGSSACPSPGFSSNDQITKGDNEVHSRQALARTESRPPIEIENQKSP